MPPQDWMNKRLSEMGEKWTVKEKASPAPTRVIQLPPEEKKARVEFSLAQFDPSEAPTTVKVDPLTDGRFSVSVTAKVMGDTAAEGLQIWIRECEKCEWISPNPNGFVEPDPHTPFDRGRTFPDVPANVTIGTWDFTIQSPRFPPLNAVAIGCFYACKNCPTVDWKRPQLLWVTKSLKAAARLQFPPISYAPEPVH
jgi:hypothetical protein